jgi:hypothetical protein
MPIEDFNPTDMQIHSNRARAGARALRLPNKIKFSYIKQLGQNSGGG